MRVDFDVTPYRFAEPVRATVDRRRWSVVVYVALVLSLPALFVTPLLASGVNTFIKIASLAAWLASLPAFALAGSRWRTTRSAIFAAVGLCLYLSALTLALSALASPLLTPSFRP